MLYISTSVWVLRMSKAGQNSHAFLRLKAKKEKNLLQNFEKTGFLDFAPKRWSSVLFPKNVLGT